QSDLYLCSFLLGGIVCFRGLDGLVADAEETRHTAAIVDHAGIERPSVLAQPATLILRIEIALDALLDSGAPRPLFVSGGIPIHAAMRAKAEIRVVQHIRCDDAIDLVILIGMHPGRDETQRRAAVRIDTDQG